MSSFRIVSSYCSMFRFFFVKCFATFDVPISFLFFGYTLWSCFLIIWYALMIIFVYEKWEMKTVNAMTKRKNDLNSKNSRLWQIIPNKSSPSSLLHILTISKYCFSQATLTIKFILVKYLFDCTYLYTPCYPIFWF